MTHIDRLYDERNIYAAIYSINNTIQDKSLMDKDDIKLLYQLNNPFYDHSVIIVDIVNMLKKHVEDKDLLFKTKVYFKFKKMGEGNIPEYRPIHSADLKTQICIIALLNLLLYDDDLDTGERHVSSLVKIIPNNFYGNIISSSVEKIFEDWRKKYKEYSKVTIEKSTHYAKTNKYKNEATLDLINFFPSIDPLFVYDLLYKKLKIKWKGEKEEEILSNILRLLLFFEVDNKFNDIEYKNYYGIDCQKKENTLLYTRGLAQGLPQSYFFANIVMIRVAEIIRKNIKDCDSYFYVDDSTIFCNLADNEFNEIINKINEELNLLQNFNCDEVPQCLSSATNKDLNSFGITYKISVHEQGEKSKIDNTGKNHLTNLLIIAHPVSGINFDIKNLFDLDNEDLLQKIKSLLKAIDKELSQIKDKSDVNLIAYRKRLTSYRKYYLFRKSLVIEKEENSVSKIEEQLDGYLADNESIFEKMENDIFRSTYRMLIKNKYSNKDSYIKKVSQVEKKLSSDKYNEVTLYYNRDVANYEHVLYSSPSFSNENIGSLAFLKSDPDYQELNNLDIFDRVIRLCDLCLFVDGKHFKSVKPYQDFVFKASNNLKRKYIRTYLLASLGMPLQYGDFYFKTNQNHLYWYELRILHYLSLMNFNISSYRSFVEKVKDEKEKGICIGTVDYNIFSVLPFFRLYVRQQSMNDDLIRVHALVSSLWKNGSKFMHFFTLHNTEHSIELIKKSVSIVSSFVVDDIGKDSYYLLFLSCYLHDISMVIYPDVFELQLSDDKLKLIGSMNDEKRRIIESFRQVDKFFENKIRTGHAADSAYFIICNHSLSFLNGVVRKEVANISYAHNSDATDVYNDTTGKKEHSTDYVEPVKVLKMILRLSDLLDMSQDRVSPDYLLQSYDSINEVSKFHWLSHLAINSCKISSTFEYLEPEVKNESFLSKGCINDNVKVNISLNTFSLLDSEGNQKRCQYYNPTISLEGRNLSLDVGEKCSFSDKKCPFICKWMNKKNSYLGMELSEICKFLNKLNDRLYKVNCKIVYTQDDKIELVDKYFNMIDAFISKE